MKELIQNILVYVVIVSVLRGLITNTKYAQYFQFFSGMIMVLIMLNPLLHFFQFENTWYDLLEENFVKMDLEDIQEEMKIADDSFADMVKEEYKKTVEKQVSAMAEEKGVTLEDVTVTLAEKEEVCQIAAITGKTVSKKTGANAGTGKQEDTDNLISVETIQIGQNKWQEEGEKQEDTSKQARKLQQQICSYFLIGEDRVHLWK
ncbi:MAG: stage III sporulation protein AF [Butyribacter sp.]|nr:stage III sporulation protein AF [bacterium]MDY3854368.1 stage III sporulation protein AF [Butyribacter sp.]